MRYAADDAWYALQVFKALENERKQQHQAFKNKMAYRHNNRR